MIVFAITGGFILFDVITGILKAVNKDGLNSTMLRKGLLHKASEVLTVAFGWGVDFACDYINLGVDLHISSIFCGYIIIMEVISILENLAEVNTALGKLFRPYLEKLKKQEEDITEEKK